MLTVELNDAQKAVEIFADSAGIDLLIRELTRLRDKPTHVHLMTPSWSGHELDEELQGSSNTLVNHMVIHSLG